MRHCILPIAITMLFLCVNRGSWSVKASLSPRASLINDALIPPDTHVTKTLSANGTSVMPGYKETSEYLIGSVAVGVIFLESNGTIDASTESWTYAEEAKVVSEIQNGLTWWANQNPSASVSFKYDIHYRVPTKYEPINRPSTDEDLWIKEAMAYLGHAGTDYFTQVRDYINALRNLLKTNWAFAIFVVDSSNDINGEFTDGFFAYAYVGGPFLVMTYDNDGWGIDKMDIATAHEMGHIFYATDEYNGVTEYRGYLNVSDVEGSGCLMAGSDAWPPSLSSGTRGQVGWRDSDGDGIQDIVDTFPKTSLSIYLPDPTNDTNLTYTGMVSEVPYPNHNPSPWSTHKDVTINTIVNVQYRVDSGVWLNASSVDGLFNETQESFSFTTQPLSSGMHHIQARGINSVGNTETIYATDTVTVDATPPFTKFGYSSPNYVRDDTLVCVSSNTFFALSAFDDITGVATTYYKLDYGSWVQYATPFTLLGTSDGLHTMYFYSKDDAGNEENITSFNFVMDNTGPIVTLISPTNGSASASNVNVSWIGSDADAGINNYEIRMDAESYVNEGLSTSHTFLNVTEGNHEVHIKAIDKLGNLNEVSVNFFRDTSLPSVSIISPSSSYLANLPNLTATWNGSDAVSGIEHYEFKLDEGDWTTTGTSTTHDISGISDGTHNLSVKAIDKAGNFKETSVTFIVDTNPPVISILPLQNGSQIKSSTIMVNWSGSDETSGIGHYRIRLDENSWVNLETNTSYTFDRVDDGDHIVYVEAIDKAGNSRQTQIHLVINTSLIGGPGWTDDIMIFGTISICVLIALGLFFVKRRRNPKMPK